MRFPSVVCFGVLLLSAAAPRIAFGQFQPPTKEELSMTSDPKAPGAAAVYLYREETEDEQHHFRTVYARIKVLSEKGKELATVHVTYRRNFVFNATGDNSSRMGSGTANHWDTPDINHNGEDTKLNPENFFGHDEVSAIEARTIHADGTVIPQNVTPADLMKSKAGDNQTNDMVFNLPSVEVGSILEYRYQVRYDRFLSAPEWQIQQPYFVHRAHYMFTPADQFLPNRSIGGAGVSSSAIVGSRGEIMTDIRSASVLPPGQVVKQDAMGRYTIDLSDIPAIPQEPYAPPLGGNIYQVNFYYTYTPDEKEYWQTEMREWTKAANQYTAPTPLIEQTVKEAVAPSDSPADKAKKLYELVQKLENTDLARGVPPSDTDRIPHGNVETVLENKRGSSLEIALLYYSLTRAAGLSARPERITSRNLRTFTPQFLSTSQLDSLVVGVNIDGKEVVVDPGERMAPFQTLHWHHTGAGGVAMGGNGKVEVVVMPLQANSDNTVLRGGSLNITPQGTVSGTVKIGFTGQMALQLRQMALRSDANMVKQQLDRMIAAQVPDGVTAHVEQLGGLDDPNKQLVAVVPVSGSIANRTGNRLVLPRLFFESKETDPFPDETARLLPVEMPYPSQEQEQITYVFPSGFTLEGTPQDTNERWEENAAYQLRSKTAVNSITTARLLAHGFTLLDASEYGKLRDFYQKVTVADHQQIVLGPAQTSSN